MTSFFFSLKDTDAASDPNRYIQPRLTKLSRVYAANQNIKKIIANFKQNVNTIMHSWLALTWLTYFARQFKSKNLSYGGMAILWRFIFVICMQWVGLSMLCVVWLCFPSFALLCFSLPLFGFAFQFALHCLFSFLLWKCGNIFKISNSNFYNYLISLH